MKRDRTIYQKPKGPSQRQLRVGERIRQVLVGALEDKRAWDPLLHNLPLTITEVRVSANLLNAVAFVLPLNGGGQSPPREDIMAALEKLAPLCRKVIAPQLGLRFVPTLIFRWDDSFESAQRIETIFNNPHVRQDLI